MIEVAAAHPVLAPLDPHVRDKLLRTAKIVPHRARSTILREGDPADRVFFLVEGSVRVFHKRAGFELLVKLFAAPAMFGEMEALAEIPFLEHVVALERSHTLQVPAVAFRKVLAHHAAFAAAVAHDVSRRLCVATVNERALVFDRVETRLASVLADYAEVCGEAHGASGRRVVVSLSQERLARDVGASERAIASAMKALRTAGLVEKARGRFCVPDLRALQRHGDRALGLSYTSTSAGAADRPASARRHLDTP